MIYTGNGDFSWRFSVQTTWRLGGVIPRWFRLIISPGENSRLGVQQWKHLVDPWKKNNSNPSKSSKTPDIFHDFGHPKIFRSSPGGWQHDHRLLRGHPAGCLPLGLAADILVRPIWRQLPPWCLGTGPRGSSNLLNSRDSRGWRMAYNLILYNYNYNYIYILYI